MNCRHFLWEKQTDASSALEYMAWGTIGPCVRQLVYLYVVAEVEPVENAHSRALTKIMLGITNQKPSLLLGAASYCTW